MGDDGELPLREISFQFVRSSGAGGQNVNKVASKAVLRWNVSVTPSLSEPVRSRLVAKNRRRVTATGDLVLSSQRFRDQARNVADCLEKLRALLREARVVPRPRRRTTATAGSRVRRLDAKRRRSRSKALRRTPRDDG